MKQVLCIVWAVVATVVNKTSAYVCDDGCQIPNSYIDDNYCDCFDCGDETNLNCSTCSPYGCTNDCSDYQYCLESLNDTFTCLDGWNITTLFVDDNYCDCSDCEDEPDYDCSSCGGVQLVVVIIRIVAVAVVLHHYRLFCL